MRHTSKVWMLNSTLTGESDPIIMPCQSLCCDVGCDYARRHGEVLVQFFWTHKSLTETSMSSPTLKSILSVLMVRLSLSCSLLIQMHSVNVQVLMRRLSPLRRRSMYVTGIHQPTLLIKLRRSSSVISHQNTSNKR